MCIFDWYEHLDLYSFKTYKICGIKEFQKNLEEYLEFNEPTAFWKNLSKFIRIILRMERSRIKIAILHNTKILSGLHKFIHWCLIRIGDKVLILSSILFDVCCSSESWYADSCQLQLQSQHIWPWSFKWHTYMSGKWWSNITSKDYKIITSYGRSCDP